ncbi:hypothetical protein V0288_22400 [Pannus brasiliensis CCIBt3594]|uniref:Uncharacterized protein n=1 Tax=Pannus brasiliensis CCIBt3594 TaxID=1427578 RepID=A0AAW9QSL6_9CHRO
MNQNEKTTEELREDLPEELDLADVYSWANDNDHPSKKDIIEMMTDYEDDEDDEYY